MQVSYDNNPLQQVDPSRTYSLMQLWRGSSDIEDYQEASTKPSNHPFVYVRNFSPLMRDGSPVEDCQGIRFPGASGRSIALCIVESRQIMKSSERDMVISAHWSISVALIQLRPLNCSGCNTKRLAKSYEESVRTLKAPVMLPLAKCSAGYWRR